MITSAPSTDLASQPAPQYQPEEVQGGLLKNSAPIHYRNEAMYWLCVIS